MPGLSISTRALAAALLVVNAACGGEPIAPPRPVASVRVTPAQQSLVVGQTLRLAAVPLADGGAELAGRAVTWRSDNDEIVAVDAQGVAQAKRPGAASVFAVSEGKEGRAVLTVSAIPVASVQLDATSITIGELHTRQLVATPRDAEGNDLADRGVVWTTDNASVATVSELGLVTAVGAGTARITATSESKSASAQVTVERTAVESVQMEAVVVDMAEGATRRLVARARGSNGEVLPGRAVQWSSSAPQVATVSGDGTVTAVEIGTAQITATIEGQSGRLTLRVLGNLAYELMYDSRTGVANWPVLYRLDIGAADAMPARLLQLDMTWDVTPSPDGSKIAFTGSDGGNTGIFVANRDGTGIVHITAGSPKNDDQPAWSPDGTKIAFRRWQEMGTPADIWVMNADGSNQVNLTNDAGDVGTQHSPTWSPRQADGSYRIAYSHQTKPGEYVVGRIFSMRADGTDKRPVTTGGEYLESEPAWSPDGQTIVFVRTGGTAFGDLWLVTATGGSERQLMAADPADAQHAPAWSPDGRYVAFTSKHELSADNRWAFHVYTVRADGTRLTRRTAEGVDKENPAWLPRP